MGSAMRIIFSLTLFPEKRFGGHTGRLGSILKWTGYHETLAVDAEYA